MPSILRLFIVLMTIFSACGVMAAKVQYSAIVVDATNGRVMHSDDADATTYPASLTKMMTLYLMFEALQQKRLSFQSLFHTSSHATTQAPSKLGLKVGEMITAQDAMLALIVKSANDVAVTVAENLAGSENHFAELMTRKARVLGMHNTTFKNASGLPHKHQKTTARDMAILGLALYKDFPKYYKYFKTTSFQYKGFTYNSHNKLVKRFAGCDGIKTGFINASGFNLVSSAKRNGRRYIVVVLGGDTAHARDRQTAQLLELAFSTPDHNQPFAQQKTALLHANAHSDQKYHALQSLDELIATVDKNVKFTENVDQPTHKFENLPISTTPIQLAKNAASTVLSSATVIQLGSASHVPNHESSWSIQIGSYAKSTMALTALTSCRKKLKSVIKLRDSITVAPLTKRTQKRHFRARLSGFTASQANQACKILQKTGQQCLVINPYKKLKIYTAMN